MDTLPFSATFLTFAYIVASAGIDITIRASQRLKDRAWALGVVGSWIGFVVIAPFCSLAPFPFSYLTLALFAGSGGFWSIWVYWEFKTMAMADASTNVLISSIRSVVLALIGITLFHEPWSFLTIVGSALILSGAVIAVPPNYYSNPRGVLLRLGAVLAGACAVVFDKILISRVGFSWTVLLGYLAPGIILFVFRPTNWQAELTGFTRSTVRPFIIAIALYVAIGPLLIGSFGYGEISSTFILSQSKIVLVLILSSLLLRENDHISRRWIGGALTLIGVALVV